MRIRFEIMLFILAVGAILSKVMVGTQILPLYNKWSGEVVDQRPNKIEAFDRIPGVKMEMRFDELWRKVHIKFVGDEQILKSNKLPTSDIICRIGEVPGYISDHSRAYKLYNNDYKQGQYCTDITIERGGISFMNNVTVTLGNIAVADMNFVGERGWIVDYLHSRKNQDHQGEGNDWL